jgi:hypothetical protein
VPNIVQPDRRQTDLLITWVKCLDANAGFSPLPPAAVKISGADFPRRPGVSSPDQRRRRDVPDQPRHPAF